MEMKEVRDFMEKQSDWSNKELLLVAAACTAVGIGIGYVVGRMTTSKNTLKKFNQKFTYDFGDDEEE